MPEEKKKHEKEGESIHEKWERDPVSRIVFGVIVIWVGIVLFLSHQDYFYRGESWDYFLLGLGIIFLGEVIVRLARPEYRRPFGGKLILAVILIAIGAGSVYGLKDWWPLIIIAAGVIIIFWGFRRSKEP